MLGLTAEMLEPRARSLAEAIRRRMPEMVVTVERGVGQVGGGALPLQRLPGWVVALERAGHANDSHCFDAGALQLRFGRADHRLHVTGVVLRSHDRKSRCSTP